MGVFPAPPGTDVTISPNPPPPDPPDAGELAISLLPPRPPPAEVIIEKILLAPLVAATLEAPAVPPAPTVTL